MHNDLLIDLEYAQRIKDKPSPSELAIIDESVQQVMKFITDGNKTDKETCSFLDAVHKDENSYFSYTNGSVF